MQVSDVRRLFAYDRWANQRLLATAGALPPAELGSDRGASFGSIGSTLVHILDGTWHWLDFFQDHPRTHQPVPEGFPNVPALAAAFAELADAQQAFGESLTEGQLAVRYSIRGASYPLEALIQHVMNHSTYHRGQVALLLRQMGRTPPATDFLVFLDELRTSGAA